MTARDEARALLAKATPGPWHATHDGRREIPRVWSDDDTDADPIALVRRYSTLHANIPDAELIAAAPRLLAALCDELDELEAKRRSEALQSLRDDGQQWEAEQGVRWEDVDKSVVTAVETAGRHVVWIDKELPTGEVQRWDALIPDEPPLYYRDADGWHKVADR